MTNRRPHPRPKPPQTCARSPAARAAPPSPHASLRRPRGSLSVPQAAPRTSPSSRTRASSNSSGRRTLSTLCERPLHLLVDHGRSRAASLVAPREFGLCSVACSISSTCIMCFFIAQTLHPYLTVAAKLRQMAISTVDYPPPPKLSCLIGAFAIAAARWPWLSRLPEPTRRAGWRAGWAAANGSPPFSVCHGSPPAVTVCGDICRLDEP